MRVVTLMTMVVSAAIVCMAQEPDIWSWNVQASWLSPVGSSSFSSIKGVPTPGDLTYRPQERVSTLQFAVGMDRSVLPELRLGGRVRYASVTLLYRANERVPIANPNGSGIYQATISHDLETQIAHCDAVPYLRYEPLSWLAVEVAAPITIPLSSRYQQRMYFSDPEEFPFLDGSIERNTGQGTIPSLSFASLSLQGRVEGIIPITASGVLALTPFLAFQQSLTWPASNGALRSSMISAGLGLRSTFNAGAEVALAPTVPRRRETILRDTTVELSRFVKQPQTVMTNRSTDSVDEGGMWSVVVRESYTTFYPKPPAILRVSMKLAFVNQDGAVSDDAQISGQRVQATYIVQLLPLVVFDSSSTILPQRYAKLAPSEVPTWKPTHLLHDAPTHWQYHIHNIIGTRMRSSRAVCTIVAYHDGTEQSKTLAEARAQAIRRYLREAFGIEERRLPLRYAPTSGILTRSIAFDVPPALLTPLTTTQMLNDTELPIVRVIPDVASEAGVQRWGVSVQTHGRTIRVISDSGALPQFIPWNMNTDLQSEAHQQDVELHLEVLDRDSTWARSEPATIRLRSQSTSDRTMIPLERTEYLDLSRAVDGYPLSPIEHRDAIDISQRNGSPLWHLQGLMEPELSIYMRATLWRKQERRP